MSDKKTKTDIASRRRRRRKARSVQELLQGVLDRDRRYPLEAYRFMFESLDYTLAGLEKVRHVRGPELLDGVREYAIEQFGLMARPVFRCWNIKETRDLGNVVFNLVDAGLMGKSGDDTIEEFVGVYEFEDVFERQVEKNLSKLWRIDFDAI